MREKLMHLLFNFGIETNGHICDGCGSRSMEEACAEIADHLIANGVTIGGSDLIPEVVCDRMLCDPEGKWQHQFRFKIGDKDWGISKELPEELVALSIMEQKWIPVNERLPEADGDYLVWNDYHKAIVGHYWPKGRYFISKAVTVTHWMPLPQPPKGE